MKRRLTTSEERYTPRKTKAFGRYLNEIFSYKPLTPDEEYDLTLRMAAGDEEARQKLIKHNLRFVISIAKQYYSQSATLEDLVNEGNYGLIIATQKFDPSRGFKFITYAVWWIRNVIIKYLNGEDTLVRIPNHKLHIIGKIKEDYNRLEQLLEKQPTANDMLHEFGNEYQESDIEEFFKQTQGQNVNLDKNVDGYEDTSAFSRMDLLVNDVFPSTDNLTHTNDSNVRLKMIMSVLKNDKQCAVITRSFGLDGREPGNIEVISREMGLSKERVRQIKEKSLELLKDKLELKYIYN